MGGAAIILLYSYLPCSFSSYVVYVSFVNKLVMLGTTCSTTESVKPEGRTWSNEEWCQQGESQVNGKENIFIV